MISKHEHHMHHHVPKFPFFEASVCQTPHFILSQHETFNLTSEQLKYYSFSSS